MNVNDLKSHILLLDLSRLEVIDHDWRLHAKFHPYISMLKTKHCKHKIWCQIILICWKRTLMWNPKTAMRYTTFVLCINRPVICCTCINSNKNYLNSFSQIFHSFCFSFLSPLFLCLNRKSENNLNNLLNKNVED